MKIFLIFVFIIINSYNFNKIKISSYYHAEIISGKKVIVNTKNKTIVILIKFISCSSCVKEESLFFNNIELDTNIKLVLVSENSKNVLNNARRKEYLKSLFVKADDVFFECVDKDSNTNYINLNKFSNSDFPVVLLINNKTEKTDTICYEKFIKMKGIRKIINFIDL